MTLVDAPVHFVKVRIVMRQLPRLLRADAQDNRDRVVEAARVLFADRGLDVPMRTIARTAEVGPATLYRRFPTKQTLIEEVFADELRSCRSIVEEGCRDPDAWRGFTTVVERLLVLNAQNQGFVDAFMSANPEAALFAQHRAELQQLLAALGDRAKQGGELRRDFHIDDLVLVLLAGRGISSALRADRENAARRFAALAIDGFRDTGANSALPRGPRLFRPAAHPS